LVNTAWYDIEMRGRRLERACKITETYFDKYIDENNPELAMSYLERLLKIEHVIQPYVEQITGLKRALAKGRSQFEHPIPSRS